MPIPITVMTIIHLFLNLGWTWDHAVLSYFVWTIFCIWVLYALKVCNILYVCGVCFTVFQAIDNFVRNNFLGRSSTAPLEYQVLKQSIQIMGSMDAVSPGSQKVTLKNLKIRYHGWAYRTNSDRRSAHTLTFQKPIMRVEPVQKGIVIQPLAGNRSSKYFKIMSLIMQLGAYSAYHVSKSRQGWFYKPYP